MSPPSATKRRLGCATAIVAAAAAVVAAGLWFGHASDADKTPCERYADLLARELDNCHSGANRSRTQLIDACERAIDPSPACLARVAELGCDALERGPAAAAADVCAKKTAP